jgi:pantoate--beta-alanine ligase
MIIFKSAHEISDWLRRRQETGTTAGFVPTMGALHAGHLSLISQARAACAVTVCSIFVNPTQFNDPADYARYPVTVEKDIDLLEKAGCDVLFLPAVAEIYPDGTEKAGRVYALGRLETLLEGHFRPGHFQGVCRVVDRLLQIIHPDQLFLGQKDYQQCMVIQRLLAITGIRTQLVIGATLREADGLAMSSRNVRLTPAGRQLAPQIYRVLRQVKEEIRPGELESCKNSAKQALTLSGCRVEYVEIADADTLEPCNIWDGKQPLVALAAVFIDGVRLIDNLPLNRKPV